jgi:hypothetical protein
MAQHEWITIAGARKRLMHNGNGYTVVLLPGIYRQFATLDQLIAYVQEANRINDARQPDPGMEALAMYDWHRQLVEAVS